MIQVTLEKAKANVQKEFPSRTVHWLTHHASHWYVCATDKDPAEGELNPYFKVDDRTGEVSEFYVVQDISLFKKILDQVKSEV
jgi:hypothetical protein